MDLKQIRFSDGTTSFLTYEEVRNRFLPMAIKEMKKANSRFLYNPVEEDDFMQIMEVEIWRAYKDYDFELGHCFTTYLHQKLRKGVRNATYSKYAKKNRGLALSISAPKGDSDLKLEDVLKAEDESLDETLHDELLTLISKNIDESEIELLKIILNKNENSVIDYAEKHGITRQGANQRVIKLRKKLQKAINKSYF